MKQIVTIILFFLTTMSCFSQTNDLGLFSLFKGYNVKSGLTMTYFRNLQGEYYYVLQQNASVVERTKNESGTALSFVILFPFSEKGKLNFLLNIPLIEKKEEGSETKLFKSQTPFGFGLAWFPITKVKFLGISGMVNFGKQNRMTEDAIRSQFFPIADYPNYNLVVGSEVPEKILLDKRSMAKKETISYNFGLIIRL